MAVRRGYERMSEASDQRLNGHFFGIEKNWPTEGESGTAAKPAPSTLHEFNCRGGSDIQNWMSEFDVALDKHGPARRRFIERLALEVQPQAGRFGFTFDVRSRHFVDRWADDAYIVARADHEFVAQTDNPLPGLHRWLDNHLEFFARSPHQLGYWLNGDCPTYDVSFTVIDKAAAYAAARQNQQVSIYHPASGRCLDVPKPQLGEGEVA